jgi:hypothetical protein
MVGLGGLEPPTSPLSVLRSSVSYDAPFNRGRCFSDCGERSAPGSENLPGLGEEQSYDNMLFWPLPK